MKSFQLDISDTTFFSRERQTIVRRGDIHGLRIDAGSQSLDVKFIFVLKYIDRREGACPRPKPSNALLISCRKASMSAKGFHSAIVLYLLGFVPTPIRDELKLAMPARLSRWLAAPNGEV